MNKVVKFETAKALKEAGFPQPETGFGQIWYDYDGTAILVFSPPGNFVTSDGTVFSPSSTDDLFFAPTATDILKELPDYALAYDSETRKPYFYCFDTLRRNPAQSPSKKKNPAEACAEAWVQTNEKT